MKTESAGGIVVNNEGKIVLVFETDFNGRVLPKGHINENETLEDASKREIYEETGLKNISRIKFLGLIEREEFGTNKIKIIHCFLYKILKETKLKKNAKWFNLDTAIRKLYFDEEKIFLGKYKEREWEFEKFEGP